MLAEFELGSALVQGMSKHDALQWIETITVEELNYHKLIFDRPVLLDFLEQGHVSGDPWYTTLPPDEGARNFIFGLVQQQFNVLFASAFESNDIGRLQQLKRFELPELDKKGPYYYAAAANLFTAYYHQLTPLVQDFTREKVIALKEFGEQPFIRTIAALPSYFDAMRNEFASTLIQAVEKLADDDVGARAEAHSLSKIARSIAVSEDIKATAKRLANQHVEGYNPAGISPTEQGSTHAAPSKRRYGCIIAAIIVFVVLRLLMMLLR